MYYITGGFSDRISIILSVERDCFSNFMNKYTGFYGNLFSLVYALCIKIRYGKLIVDEWIIDE